MKSKRKTIIILIISIALLGVLLMISLYHGRKLAGSIAQKSNIVQLKLQIAFYEDQYDCLPDSIEALKLPTHFTNTDQIKNIKYPDDKYLFYEKETRQFGFKKGRFYVYKDGFIEFVPVGETPPERKPPERLIESVEYFDSSMLNKKAEKYYDKGVPTKIITYYRIGGKKGQELYKDGKKHGEWIKWDENGKVLEKEYYENGVLQNNSNTGKEKTKDNK